MSTREGAYFSFETGRLDKSFQHDNRQQYEKNYLNLSLAIRLISHSDTLFVPKPVTTLRQEYSLKNEIAELLNTRE